MFWTSTHLTKYQTSLQQCFALKIRRFRIILNELTFPFRLEIISTNSSSSVSRRCAKYCRGRLTPFISLSPEYPECKLQSGRISVVLPGAVLSTANLVCLQSVCTFSLHPQLLILQSGVRMSILKAQPLMWKEINLTSRSLAVASRPRLS